MQKVSLPGLFVLLLLVAGGLYFYFEQKTTEAIRTCRKAAPHLLDALNNEVQEYAILQAAMEYYGVQDPYDLLEQLDVETSLRNLKTYGDELTPLDAYGIPREDQPRLLEQIRSILEGEFEIVAIETRGKARGYYRCRAYAAHEGMADLTFTLDYNVYPTPGGLQSGGVRIMAWGRPQKGLLPAAPPPARR